MKHFWKLTAFALTFFLLQSCKSDKPNITARPTVIEGGNKVWVVNEGNFQFGNAALGIYNSDAEQYSSEVFKNANNKPLGDVFQSITLVGSKAYLMVNNSSKIEVIDTGSFTVDTTLTGFTSPRYMLKISDQKAYVSDLYGKGINVLDLTSNTISKKIPASEWTEKMLAFNGKVYVSMPKSEHIYVIDVTTDMVEDSIPVAYGSNSLVVDKNEMLWVLCQGDQSKNKEAGLYQINPSSQTINQSFTLDKVYAPQNLTISNTGKHLFFIYDDLLKMDINDTQIPDVAFYPANGRVFYGLGINPFNSEIYLADAKDYVQKGIVHRLDANGDLISSFQTDIIPSGFVFPNQ